MPRVALSSNVFYKLAGYPLCINLGICVGGWRFQRWSGHAPAQPISSIGALDSLGDCAAAGMCGVVGRVTPLVGRFVFGGYGRGIRRDRRCHSLSRPVFGECGQRRAHRRSRRGRSAGAVRHVDRGFSGRSAAGGLCSSVPRYWAGVSIVNNR